MTTEYKVSRQGWMAGPWDDEPDYFKWTDEKTGLACMIARASPMGNLCGYVGVDETHPRFKVVEFPADLIVHGGITYCGPDEAGYLWWLGFDCGHAFDYQPGLMACLNDTPGFAEADIPEFFLSGTYRTFDFVLLQCTNLAA